MTRLEGKQNNRTPLIIGTVIVVLLIGFGLWFMQRNQMMNAQTGPVKTFDFTGQPFIGKADAPVKVVIFEDFKCPLCKQFEDNIFPVIQQKYIDTGKVQAYRINYPFLADHLPTDDSLLAAQAAECAYDQKGNDGYNRMSTILFRAQGNETTVWATKDKLVELAGSVDGIDVDKLKTCLDTDATKARAEADKKQGNAANVQATPSVFINGQLIPTSQFNPEGISQLIDDALTAAPAAK